MLDPTRNHDERLLRIALAIIAQPGDPAVAACVDHRDMAATITILADHDSALSQTSRRPSLRSTRTTPQLLLSAAAEVSEHSLIPDDEWWPGDQLEDLEKLDVAQPWCIWVKTRLGIDPRGAWGRAVAIVGTGDHTGYGYDTVRRLTRDLVHQRQPVATLAATGLFGGGGLSAAAHRTATATAGGISLVIGHEPVTGPAATTGAACQPEIYLTTTPEGVKAGSDILDYHARLHAALTAGMAVVETGSEAHVLAAIEAARDLGKPLMALPGPVRREASAFCHHLIRQGRARLITSARELITDIAPEVWEDWR